MATDLRARVLDAARHIPRGKVASYRDLAALAGNALAARAAGAAMRDAPAGVPWWRVIASDGSLRCGRDQETRLRREGVGFTRSGRVRVEEHRWQPSRRAGR